MKELVMYEYGYLHQRGHGPGCQPRGFTDYSFNFDDKYYGRVIYNRELSVNELYSYDLEFVTKGSLEYKILSQEEAYEKLKQLNVKNLKWYSSTFDHVIIEDKVVRVCRRLPTIESTLYFDDEYERPQNNFANFKYQNIKNNQIKKLERKVYAGGTESILTLVKNDNDDVFRLEYVDPYQGMGTYDTPVGPGQIDIINEVIDINAQKYEKRLSTYWKKYKDNVRWVGYWRDR